MGCTNSAPLPLFTTVLDHSNNVFNIHVNKLNKIYLKSHMQNTIDNTINNYNSITNFYKLTNQCIRYFIIPEFNKPLLSHQELTQLAVFTSSITSIQTIADLTNVNWDQINIIYKKHKMIYQACESFQNKINNDPKWYIRYKNSLHKFYDIIYKRISNNIIDMEDLVTFMNDDNIHDRDSLVAGL